MKKIKNILLYSFLVGVIMLKSASISNASNSDNKESEYHTLYENKLTAPSFEDFANNLFLKLNSADEEDYGEIIKKEYDAYPTIFSFNNMNQQAEYFNSIPEVINNNKNFLINKSLNVPQFNRQDSFIVTPQYVIYDKLITDDVNDKKYQPFYTSADSLNNSTVKTRYANNTRTIYNFAGVKVIDSTLECRFAYNGNKAWFYNGFNYYYTRGIGSPWTVTNWKGWHESNGTSYTARSGGNFQYGLTYEGNGLVIQDIYLKNFITCTKSGSIIKSR